MKRGVITLEKAEVREIDKRVNLDSFVSSPLKAKVKAGLESTSDQVPIEVSEEELEYIMDEIVIPDPEKDSEATKTLRKKIQDLLGKFREGGLGNI